MKCGYCGNDLMLGIVPKGPARLLRLLPMSAYRCVRCGGLNWRLSEAYGAVGSRLVLTVLLLAALGLSYWLGATYGLPVQGVSAVRREVAMAPAQPPRAALPQPEAVATPPAPQPQPAQAEPEAEASVRPAPEPEPEAAPAPGPAARQTPAPDAVAEAAPQAAPSAEPAPAPAPAASGELEEVVVTPTAPAPREKPVVVAANKAAKGPSSKWAMRLLDVAAQTKGGSVTVTIRANATQEAPNAFALASPPRYVLDLPGTWAAGSVRELAAKGGIVRSVRLGMRDNGLRVVLDLARQPASEPVISVSGETVTVTLR